MRSQGRHCASFLTLSLLILAAGTFLGLSSANAAETGDGSSTSMRAWYDDNTRFDQLSSAARTLLERKYGRKPFFGGPLPSAPSAAQRALGTSAVENVLVNDPTADATDIDTQSETTLVLGPNGRIIVGYNDSGSVLFGSHFTGFSVSTDGGASFTDKGTLPDSLEGDAGDPVLARDETTGTIYFVTLGFETGERLQVFRSFNNGDTFTAPVNGSPGFIGSGDFQDKPWMTVDNFPGPGRGNVYIAWRHFTLGTTGGIRFTRSINGGDSFSPNQSILIAPEGDFNVQGAYVTVGPDHAVYVFWLDQSAGIGTPNQIRVRKSVDQGLTFGPAITVATLNTTGVNGSLGLEFRSNGFPQAVVNSVNSQIYVVYNDNTIFGDRGDIFFTSSEDGGATWSTPVPVNDDSTVNDQWQPALAVTPDGTRLFIGFYDRRLDPGNRQIDTFGLLGKVDLEGFSTVCFGRNFRITDQSFPAVFNQDPVINPTYMGDYDVAVADNEFFYYTWADNRLPNDFHENQPDVRFAKIPVEEPGGVIPVFVGATVSGGNGNGFIDFNECNRLSVELRNLGCATATGVTARISTTTAGVTIALGSATYPPILGGNTATNRTPFFVSTEEDFPCGVPVEFTLVINTPEDGSFTNTFQFIGNVGNRFNNDFPVIINDLTTVDSTIDVAGIEGSITNVTVSLFITHTFDADLIISLIAPDGTTINLSTQHGGSGDNFGRACSPDTERTTFSDSAATPIAQGRPPFVGSFRPDQPLGTFNGKSGSAVNGTWRLRVADVLGADSGVLHCWSLTFGACQDGRGQCEIQDPDLTGFWTAAFRRIGSRKLVARFSAMNRGKLKNIPTSVQFWLSRDANLDGTDILLKQVAIGGLSRFRPKRIKGDVVLPETIPTVQGRFLIAVVDPADIVQEANETNNRIVFGPIP